MKSWLLLLLLITSANSLLAQPPIVEWYKTLGGFEGDYAHSIWPTSDGGYITAGYTEGEGGDVVGYHGNKYLNDVWIVKLNRNGTVEWQKCLGGIGVEHGADIRQTPNGGYMVAFTSWSKDCDLVASHGGVDFMVVKLTPTGDIEWQKSYGGSKNEYAYSITPSTNGGYIVAGTTESGDGDVTGYHGKRDYWVIKIDDSGNLLWQKCLGGSGDDPALSAASTADGGCIVGGYTESSDGDVTTNHGQRDAWVVKLGGTGNLQWQKSFGGSSFDEAWSVQEGSDGGYIFAGRTTSNNGDVSGNHQSIGGFSDYWVVKLASNGSLQWQRCYGGKFNDEAYHIQNTSDGGYIITGKAEAATDDVSCLSGNNDAWLVKINNVGAIQWQKSLGGDGIDVGYCTRQLSDGSFIMAGFTCSNNITGWHPHTTSSGTCADFFLVKLSVPSPTPPKPSVKIKAGAICKGSVSTLVAESLNAGLILSYQWTRGGQPVGTNKSTYSAADFTDGEKVICLLVGNGLCENLVMVSDTVVIKLNNNTLNPTVNITADETAACNCMKLTFRATANGGGTAPAFQWQVNNNNTGNNGLAFSSKSLSLFRQQL